MFWWSKRQELAQEGERAAVRYLKRKGLRILARNWSCRQGELDIVALDGRQIVFVEVKTRQTDEAGGPFESITPLKQRNLTRTALAYLKKHKLLEYPARFDVVAVAWPEKASEPNVTHIVNAFEPPDRFQMFS
jgi:putative endonuclease